MKRITLFSILLLTLTLPSHTIILDNEIFPFDIEQNTNQVQDILKPFGDIPQFDRPRRSLSYQFFDYTIPDEAECLYVSAKNGYDTNSGTKSSPLSTLQTAINRWNYGDYAGIMVHGDQTGGIEFNAVTNLTLIGGWDETFSAFGKPSVIDGEAIVKHVVFLENSRRVNLINFTITGGNADGTNFRFNCGGGIYAKNIRRCVINCVVSNNTAKNFGGGIFLSLSHLNQIAGDVTHNTASAGGGIFAMFCVKNTVSANAIANSADISGAGIYLVGSSQNTLSGDVRLNRMTDASAVGAGITLAASPYNTVSGTISANSNSGLKSRGGGIYINDTARNIVTADVIANYASQGGGIYLFGAENTDITGTVVSNNALIGSGLFIKSSYDTDYSGAEIKDEIEIRQ